MLRAALSAGITPDAFWRLSLREWRWLAGERSDAMSRAQLAALMGAFPDGNVRDASSFDFAQDESALS